MSSPRYHLGRATSRPIATQAADVLERLPSAARADVVRAYIARGGSPSKWSAADRTAMTEALTAVEAELSERLSNGSVSARGTLALLGPLRLGRDALTVERRLRGELPAGAAVTPTTLPVAASAGARGEGGHPPPVDASGGQS